MASSAEILVPSLELTADIALLEAHGFRLDVIFPADDPRVARLSGNGLQLRLDTSSAGSASTIMVDGVENEQVTSAGTRLVVADSPSEVSPFADDFVVTRGGEWGQGRAGMEYRDLIPDRHGGRVIASHIRIVEAGPVPDYVHHHDIRFQMIYCRRGRVQVIYEDQGDAFWMETGDCVLQPPHIRHRVLASDGGCEVVEIASPAEHPTFVEHEIELPTAALIPQRDFGGQRFSFDRAGDLPWTSAGDGWEEQVNNIAKATDGLATVRVLKPAGTGPMNDRSRGQGPSVSTQPLSGLASGDLCLLFVLEGTASVRSAGVDQNVALDDSIAIKSGDGWIIDAASDDFRCLHVALTGAEI